MANGSYPMTTGVGAVALTALSDDDPSFISSAVMAMQPQWEPIDVCLAGTRGLRANCRSLIPQEPSESDDAYKRRIFHSTLPPFLSRLASQAAGIILRRGVKIEGDEFWLQWAQNVTGDGTTIDEYARRQLMTALLYGHSSTIVDFSADSTPRTLAEERQMARRPYLVPVHPRQVLGWRLSNDSASSELTQVRIREQVTLPAGAYGEDVVEQIRVLTPGGYELWRSEPLTALPTGFSLTTPRKWTLVDSGTTSLNRIPLCTVYSQRTGNLTSTPPLGEIAHLAIAYAQRFADLHHGIHVGSNPMLVLRGFDPDSDTPLGISVNTALLLPPDGGAEFVAAPSEAYDSQLRCLQALEDQISRLGINTLTSQNLTNAAAEARRMDRIDSDSIMASISLDLERTLNQLFELAAEYVGVEPPQVLIPRDYDNRMLTGNDTTALLQLYMQNAISQQTLLKILQDGEILPPNVDIDKEIALTQEQAAEAMALNNLTANGLGPGGPDMAFQNAGQGESLNSQTLPTPLRPGRNAN